MTAPAGILLQKESLSQEGSKPPLVQGPIAEGSSAAPVEYMS